MSKFLKAFGAASVCATIAAGPAAAATVDLVSVEGFWSDATASGSVSGVGGTLIEWGTPSGQPDQSGYLFTAALPQNDILPDTNFSLGVFTHLNNPITGSVLNYAQLTVVVGLSIDGGATEFVTTVFDFDHWETPNLPNSLNPNRTLICANGELNARGVNINGCADRVTATANFDSSQTFDINGVSYSFEFSGFRRDDMLFDEFWTTERADNSAILRARYTLSETPSQIPLPASALLLLGGLGALTAMRRSSPKT